MMIWCLDLQVIGFESYVASLGPATAESQRKTSSGSSSPRTDPSVTTEDSAATAWAIEDSSWPQGTDSVGRRPGSASVDPAACDAACRSDWDADWSGAIEHGRCVCHENIHSAADVRRLEGVVIGLVVFAALVVLFCLWRLMRCRWSNQAWEIDADVVLLVILLTMSGVYMLISAVANVCRKPHSPEGLKTDAGT